MSWIQGLVHAWEMLCHSAVSPVHWLQSMYDNRFYYILYMYMIYFDHIHPQDPLLTPPTPADPLLLNIVTSVLTAL